ncbi:LysR family transcriptional regulator [Nocardioides jensenii]|uniref:LysR family transcriptional regulator n=1 Tax=Nocardioides jensenii TaxID=1843 RepID=UPI00082AA6FE|nr:LysR family transcriptional regulator [Nocardioides jensenii]
MTTDRPDLTALELLVRVGELGSLGAAARAVDMAQPNASRAIARLERQLRVVLIHRSATGSRLTTEGGVVAEWAREALAGVDRVVVGALSLAEDHKPHLTVAASLTIAEYLAPGWLARLRRLHPELQVSLDVGNSHDVLEAVGSARVPLGFVESPVVPRTVGSAVVMRDRLVVIVAPEHPWSRRRRPITAAELAATRLILREAGSGTRDTLEAALAREGHTLSELEMELASTAAVKASVATGGAPAVLSELAVVSELAGGALVSVPLDEALDLARPLRAVWPRSTRPTGVAADVVRIARGRS